MDFAWRAESAVSFGRRARRILPAYYAALLSSLALIWLVPGLGSRGDTQWDVSLEAAPTAAGNLISHALLFHNWLPSYETAINAPLWSVALEWQIYFVFALLLVPVWRRFGASASLLLATVLGLAPLALHGAFVSPWMLIAFALGMWGASLSEREGAWTDGRWALLGCALACCAAFGLRLSSLWQHPGWSAVARVLGDLLIASSSVVFLVRNARRAQQHQPLTALGRLCSSRAAGALGRFSYSLYLMHFPLLAWFFQSQLRDEQSGVTALAKLLLLGVPLILAVSWAFSLLFERAARARRACAGLALARAAGAAGGALRGTSTHHTLRSGRRRASVSPGIGEAPRSACGRLRRSLALTARYATFRARAARSIHADKTPDLAAALRRRRARPGTGGSGSARNGAVPASFWPGSSGPSRLRSSATSE